MRKAFLRLNKTHLLFLIIIVFTNCRNNNRTTQEIIGNLESNEASIDSIIEIVYSVPDAYEILNEILINSKEFKPDITNSVENVNHYFESKSIALNIGVYFSDMAYHLLRENNALAHEYFKTIIQMSSNLGLSNFQSVDLLLYFENNTNNKDTLHSIFKESIYDIKVELENSNRNKILGLIYTGSIIESLYLAINNIDHNDSKEVIEKIIEQNIVIENLSDFLSLYKLDSDITITIEQLDSIKYFINKCITQDTTLSVQKNVRNQLIFKGGIEAEFNIEDFEFVKSKITELRNAIIEI